MPGGVDAGALDEGRGTGVAEDGVDGTVRRMGEAAEGVAGAEKHAGGAAMRAKEGRLMEAVDPAGASVGKVEGHRGLGQAEAAVQEGGVVGLRMVRGLGDEDDGVDGRRIDVQGGKKATGGVLAEIQSGDAGRGHETLAQSDSGGDALQLGAVDPGGKSVGDEVALDGAGGHGHAGDAEMGKGGMQGGRNSNG